MLCPHAPVQCDGAREYDPSADLKLSVYGTAVATSKTQDSAISKLLTSIRMAWHSFTSTARAVWEHIFWPVLYGVLVLSPGSLLALQAAFRA